MVGDHIHGWIMTIVIEIKPSPERSYITQLRRVWIVTL